MHLNRIRRLGAAIPLCFSALALSGCQKDMSDLQQYVAKVKARPAGTIEPIPELRPYRSFKYPQHSKDPFDGSVLRPKAVPVFDKGISIDHSRRREYLENFPLDSLMMVGTVNQKGILWGLLKTADGDIHRVKVGNYAGQNYGKITGIDEGRITLQEIVENGQGGFKERDNSIALSEPG